MDDGEDVIDGLGEVVVELIFDIVLTLEVGVAVLF